MIVWDVVVVRECLSTVECGGSRKVKQGSGRGVNGWRGGGGRKLREDWLQMKSCKGSCLHKSKSCIFE